MKPTDQRERCVIADDVRGSREALAKYLTHFPLDLVPCADGQTAWGQGPSDASEIGDYGH